jgi:amino acid adenylation domain-containing protein/non-ribosomal peptide synthase protein (TIGR01720 family)
VTTVELLSCLRSLDVRLWVDGDRLRYTAPNGALTPALLEALAAYKKDVINLLRKANAAQKPGSQSIPPVPRTERLPLSFAQQRLWFLHELEPGNIAYNMPAALFLDDCTNVATLDQTVGEIVRRHEILRTTFPSQDGKPYQRIAPAEEQTLPLVDLSGLDEPLLETYVKKLARLESQRPFNLQRGPLSRATLIRLDERRYLLLYTLHHIICDGWSLALLVKEMTRLYEVFFDGKPSPLPELFIQYADFAAWQRKSLQGETLEAMADYWKRQLEGAPATLDLPTDGPRPSSQSYRGKSIPLFLPEPVTRSIKRLCQRENVTPFMVLLLAFKILLHRYSGQSDIQVGTPIAERNRLELEPLIGMFLNTLVLRTEFSGDPTIRELLRRVRKTTLGAYANQDLPFETLIERLKPERVLNQNPLFQVLFNLQNARSEDLRLKGMRLSWLEIGNETAQFDLNLSLIETEQSIKGLLIYNTDLFGETMIARMLEHYMSLVQVIVADPEKPLSSLPSLTESEAQQILFEWNDTENHFNEGETLHGFIEQQVRRTPDALAVVFSDEHLTYHELNRRANQLAHALRELGVGPDALVGICLERSLSLVIGLLAILKAGGAYMPLDFAYPKKRLAFMIEEARPAVLITNSDMLERLPDHKAQVICVDACEVSLSAEATENLRDAPVADNLAYLIYTSGSTGKPKGVMNIHRGIANRLLWMQDAYRLDTDDRVLQKTPFSFDVSVWEFFWPLMTGAALIIALPEGHKDSAYIKSLIDEEQVTVLHFVPSMLDLFISEPDIERCLSLRKVLCSGETLPAQLQSRFHERVEAELHNLYGPTEAAVDVTFWKCKRGDESRVVPIGRPIANTQIFLLANDLQPVPIKAAGELYIGGVGPGRGYFNRPELTAERFIPNPFSEEAGQRLYKTGDLARHLDDGNIEFLRRVDHQVKIHGFRIELEEIEIALGQHPLIKDAIVIARKDATGDRLAAYIVTTHSESLPVGKMRAYLKDKLPEYMVPSIFVAMDRLPLLPSGKIDRRSLPAPEGLNLEPDNEFVAPRTHVEQVLADILKQVLRVERASVHSNFFELGGDSIIGAQIIAKANQAGLRLTLKQLFQHQTIAELAAVAGTTRGADSEQGLVTGEVPLTPIQRRFFDCNRSTPHYFNQALMLEVDQELDPALLRAVVHRLMLHHDALRLRFIREESGWKQFISGPEANAPLIHVDLSTLTAEQQRASIEEEAARLQASLNLSEGPLFRFATFYTGSQHLMKLLIVIHHLAVDAMSWRILLEDLETGYRQASNNSEIKFPSKTSSYKKWANTLAAYAESEHLRAELDYWLSELQPARALPVDFDECANTAASADTVSFSLSVEETTAMLQEMPKAYHTEINDVLLAALLEAYTGWAQQSEMLIDLERHGREEIADDLDLSRTVGWFTCIAPVLLRFDGYPDPEELLSQVKSRLRQLANHSISYDVLRYLSSDAETKLRLSAMPEPQICFNYLGQLDQALPESSPFKPANESSGPAQSLEAARQYLIEIMCSVFEGKLQMSLVYSRNVHKRSTIEQLAEAYSAALRSLISSCVEYPSERNVRFSCGEFFLSRREVADITARLQDVEKEFHLDLDEIEDFYPLSPTQQGILYHTLFDADTGVYFQQLRTTFNARLDPEAFMQAWRQVVNRHAILRSSFVYESVKEPIQVVRKNVKLPFEYYDWRGLAAAQQQEMLERLLRNDRDKGFNLYDPPLMRLTLIELDESDYQFIWSFHHILLDGWSSNIIYREVGTFYESLIAGREINLAPPPAYRDYIAWLRRRDLSESESFWRKELKGFREPTPLMLENGLTDSPDEKAYGEQQAHLSVAATRALQDFGRQRRLTLNTIVMGAWALLLSRYSGHDDVLFGLVISGRPGDLPGVESMVGLFVNTLPMRVRVEREESIVNWLTRLQQHQVEIQQFEYTPLAEIQRWSEVAKGTPLFESIFAFENYPVEARSPERDRAIEATIVGAFEMTSYPLTIMAGAGSQLTIKILYDYRSINPSAVGRILNHFQNLLEDIVENSDKSVSALSMIEEVETRLLMDDFNANLEEY